MAEHLLVEITNTFFLSILSSILALKVQVSALPCLSDRILSMEKNYQENDGTLNSLPFGAAYLNTKDLVLL